MLTHQAFDWNAVVLGAWNRAILTPSGIATKLFQLSEGTPVEVLVPIEGLGYPKVSHGGLTATANSTRLIIEVDRCDFTSLRRAMDTARTALDALPETPVSAAGYNIRYKGPSLDTVFPEITEASMNLFSDMGYRIRSNSVELQVEFRTGTINVKGLIDSAGDLTLGFNFHKDSNQKDELIAWFMTPISEIEGEIEKLVSTLGLTTKERV